MNTKILTKNTASAAVTAFIGFLLLAGGPVLCEANRFLYGILLMFCAVGLYLAISILVADKNWMDIRAVFSGVWLFTIGLAALRLTEHQEPWQDATWLLLAVTYFLFQISATLGNHMGGGLLDRLKEKNAARKTGPIRWKLNENRLFWICVTATAIGFLCFVINVAIRGYIPAFSDDPAAYLYFYTRYYIFCVASTGVSGLCYYVLRTQKLTLCRKIILAVCLVYLVLVFPILSGSRGTFVVTALSLTTAVFYLHKKRFWILLLCLVAIFGVYLTMTSIRGYSDEELDNFFESSDIPIISPSDENPTENEETFSLSPSATFLYTYLTVSHDNFNEAVQNAEKFAYGTKQLTPFNVILRSEWIQKNNSNVPLYLVRGHLNTTNLVSDFYYDFGGWGVVVLTFLWGFVFGIMQGFYTHGKGPISLMVLGNTMTPVALSFFATWLSSFTHWMLWGVALLAALAGCICLRKKSAVSGDPL